MPISNHIHNSNWNSFLFCHKPNDFRYGLFGALGKDQFIAIAASSTPQTAINMLTELTTYFLNRLDRYKDLKMAVKKCPMIRKENRILAS